MKFRYSIARYMPSLVRGEVLNLGVVVEDEDGRIAGKFLSRLSHIRAIYADADMATLRLVRDYFGQQYPAAKQPALFATEDALSLDELVRLNQNVLSFDEPRVTLGDTLIAELEDLYLRFVAPSASFAPKPISSVQVAPALLRKRLEGWLTKVSLLGPRSYLRDIEVPGTVYPWTFDFGLRNGNTTVVQAVSLRAPLDVAMGRAALVAARISDAREAMVREHSAVEAVAVPDVMDAHEQPIVYLRSHKVEVISFKETERLQERLRQPLRDSHLGEPIA